MYVVCCMLNTSLMIHKKNHIIQKNINSDDTMLNNIILMVHNVMKH